MEIKTVKLKDLRIRKGKTNPRGISKEALAGLGASIDTFGLVEPVVWNKRSGRVVGGHQRLKVLRKRKAKQTQVVVVDLDDAQEDALCVALNNPGIAGAFTSDVEQLLDRIRVDDEALYEALLLDEVEWEVDEERQIAKQDDVPDPPKKAITKKGDLWSLGNHRLLCGDCRKSMKRLCAGKKFDLLVTDPPYGVSYADKNRFLNAVAPANRIQEPIEGDHKTPDEMSALWKEAFSAVRKFAKPGACYYITGPQGGDLLLLLLLALRDSGFPLRHMLIWSKNVHVLGRADYNYQHEPILYGWVGGAGHYFGGSPSEVSLWEIPKPHQSKLHPTMKPVELYARAIQNGSRKEEIVADPFSGSGTCIIAAQQLDRVCYAMEVDPKYCDVIVERWQQFTGKKAKRIKK